MIPSRSPVAIRLGKLAEAGRTGTLYLSGDSGGVIHLSGGDVIAADSRRTPGLAARIGPDADQETVSWFDRSWIAREATVDAVMELMSARPRHVRFRGPEEEPSPIGAYGIPVAALITEVSRRHQLMRQMADVLTPDTTVARNPRLKSPATGVSDGQWAILMQLSRPATPRGLALELGQSVFGTTIEVFRMVIMDLLSVANAPARLAAPARDGRRPALSFVRALAG